MPECLLLLENKLRVVARRVKYVRKEQVVGFESQWNRRPDLQVKEKSEMTSLFVGNGRNGGYYFGNVNVKQCIGVVL